MSQFKAQELCQLKELFRFTNRLLVSDSFGLLRHTFVGLTTVDKQIGREASSLGRAECERDHSGLLTLDVIAASGISSP
ncbi:hypothetical protein X726_28920 [Mesorhizobium sp. L103C105A0]|nr:hypothetical protein X726_28920 [Mesorhizobium sp. L103C105A0]